MSKEKETRIVRNGVVETGPKAKDPHDFGRDGASIAYANLQRTGLPTQSDINRALDQSIRDRVRRDVPAFSAIASRGGTVPERPVPREEPRGEIPIGPPPGIAIIDAIVNAHLPQPKPPKPRGPGGSGEAA